MLKPTVDVMLQSMARKGYVVFTREEKNYNLNIIGIRSEKGIPNRFDDTMVLLWRYQSLWNIHYFPITTDPGTYWLNNPMGVKGTAILKPGQYRNSHKIGFHQGKYQALVQYSPLTVYRDANKDSKLDFFLEQEGLFGINIHRASAHGSSVYVDRWSAGCQVFASAGDFYFFMEKVKASSRIHGNIFTYTLLDEIDLVRTL